MSDKEKAREQLLALEALMAEAQTNEVRERLSIYSTLAFILACLIKEPKDEEEKKQHTKQAKFLLEGVFTRINMLATMLPPEDFQKLMAAAGKNVVNPTSEEVN